MNFKFRCLASISSDLHGENLALNGVHLENMYDDIQTRFSDLIRMAISIAFEINVAHI